jgi:hypothetical protein
MNQPTGDSQQTHLTESEVSAYLSGIVGHAQRERIQAHLSRCDECTEELTEVWRLTREAAPALARRPHRMIIGVAAGIAAVMALFLWTGRQPFSSENQFREPALTFAAPPRPLAPLGTAQAPITLRWSAVPSTNRYRVILFDREGSVIWETEVRDTVAPLADSVPVVPGSSYFWKVQAETGLGRSTESPLTEFEVLP